MRARVLPVRVPYLPGAPEDAAELGKRLGYPLVVKPRFSVRGRGSSRDRPGEAGGDVVRRVLPTFGMPMLQEWIPGGLDQRVSVAVTLDRAGRAVTVHARRHVRTILRSFVSLPCAQASCTEHARGRRCDSPPQALGYVGHARVQVKIDPRDGVAKLMEINCRPGLSDLVRDVGWLQPVPLLCVRIHRGGEPVDAMAPHAGPDVFLNPDRGHGVARRAPPGLDAPTGRARQRGADRQARSLSVGDPSRVLREPYRVAPRRHFD